MRQALEVTRPEAGDNIAMAVTIRKSKQLIIICYESNGMLPKFMY